MINTDNGLSFNVKFVCLFISMPKILFPYQFLWYFVAKKIFLNHNYDAILET